MRYRTVIKQLIRLIDAQEKMLVAYRIGGTVKGDTLDTLAFKKQWLNNAKDLLKKAGDNNE